MDPFIHHPELRDVIEDPLKSFFRDFNPEQFDEMMLENGHGPDWRLSDEERELSRTKTLENIVDQDLWVFGYGSLCWDPGFLFDEVRRAYVSTHERKFILKDTLGGVGDLEQPGLMAALDTGSGCHGMVFRIPADQVEHETRSLWGRERLVPAYQETFVHVETAQGTVKAIAFVADHDADMIDADMSREEQVQCLLKGTGFLGTSLDYITNLQSSLNAIGISDPHLDDLLTFALNVSKGVHLQE